MEQTAAQLLSLLALAKALSWPEDWIKAEADARRTPYLRIGKRYRFNLEEVIRRLTDRTVSRAKGVRHV
jgi:hypothetical protein